MKPPLQQTLDWQKLLKDLGYATFWQKGQGHHYLAELKTTPVGNYLYVPYGPCATTKQGVKKAYDSLSQLAAEQKAIFIRVEPQNQEHLSLLKSFKAKKSHDLNPADSWILDLTPDKADLLHGFSQGTRTRYNQFPKKGLSVTTSKNPNDIKHLVDFQQQLAKVRNIGTFSEKYLKAELAQDFAVLYLVHYTPPETNIEKIIAASLFFDYSDTRYYMQSAADLQYRKLPATVALLSTALFDAKKQGITKFDFWGIAPDNAPDDHPWAGFTEFKKSFGGEAVHYCGTWDIVNNSAKYRLYQALRKAIRIKRKITK